MTLRPACDNLLIIACWLEAEARQQELRLAPRQLHLLLYFAIHEYAKQHKGRLLAPASFTAWKLGPREANLYAFYAEWRGASVSTLPPAPEICGFLDGLWAELGTMDADSLHRLLTEEPAYSAALANGEGSLIDLEYCLEAALHLADYLKNPDDDSDDEFVKPFTPRVLTGKAKTSKPASKKQPPVQSSYVTTPTGQKYQRWIPPTRSAEDYDDVL